MHHPHHLPPRGPVLGTRARRFAWLLASALVVAACSSTETVRDDDGFWTRVEEYVSAHTEAQFSHGLCPGCAEELYPELDLNASSVVDSTENPR